MAFGCEDVMPVAVLLGVTDSPRPIFRSLSLAQHVGIVGIVVALALNDPVCAGGVESDEIWKVVAVDGGMKVGPFV